MSRFRGRARGLLVGLGVAALVAVGAAVVVVGPRASADPGSEWAVTTQCSFQAVDAGWPAWTAKADAILSELPDGSVRITRVESFRSEIEPTFGVWISDFGHSSDDRVQAVINGSGGRSVQWTAWAYLRSVTNSSYQQCTAVLNLDA